ncbi:TatD family hydrolase [Lysinibacillus sp. NPDC097287]|uniref:TatD family hydrolase n=1 Tax=Lysinibacillus sp. NPDC097287 TaxID=3364144 RepID=UPI00380232EB
MTYIDTHVHIDFYPNPYDLALEYEKNKIYTLFVTNLPELYEKHFSRFSNFKYIRLCLGYHPQVSTEYVLNKTLFEKYIDTTRYVGEVGLDFFSGIGDREKSIQIEAFRYVTSPIFNIGRIYTIHSKGAEREVLDILIENEVKHAIFHWYTGKISVLKQAAEKGYYFSINPKMLMTKNGLNIIANIPVKQMLFETDGPFARINRNPIHPTDIPKLYSAVENEVVEFEKVCFSNFRRLLIEKDL